MDWKSIHETERDRRLVRPFWKTATVMCIAVMLTVVFFVSAVDQIRSPEFHPTRPTTMTELVQQSLRWEFCYLALLLVAISTNSFPRPEKLSTRMWLLCDSAPRTVSFITIPFVAVIDQHLVLRFCMATCFLSATTFFLVLGGNAMSRHNRAEEV